MTAIDSASPDFGSGSHVGGLGLVFVIAAIISVLGIGLMMLSRLRAPAFFLGFGLDGLGAFREDADAGGVAHARLAFGIADDVVVQIGLDPPALGLGVVGQDLAAQQALFLAR